MYQAYITRIKNVRPHPNADKLNLGDCFGNTICIPKTYEENMLGIYFPTDGQLSEDYCNFNNLVRKKDEAGNNIGGFMEPDKRNVKAIKLRGEKSDGLFMPLNSLEYIKGLDISTLEEGLAFTSIAGVAICQKYIPRGNHKSQNTNSQGNRTRKKKVPVAPLFAEHADTEQLAYNISAFKPNDEIEITLKIHGTSQRTGYLPVFKGYKRSLLDFIFRREGKPIYEYGYVSGTRRTILEDFDGGFYGSNQFREQHSKKFEGKLMKGETVYYEVAGFTDTGTPIMGDCDNRKLGKEFVAQYGEKTTFSYGCYPNGVKTVYGNDDKGAFELPIPVPQSELYVYRMTMTNEDGFVVEYSPDFMRYRCEQMEIKCVPVFAHFILHDYDLENDGRTPGEIVKDIAEKYYAGADPIGKTHTREGVVCRIINRPKFCAYKHKNYEFKMLEGLIKETANAPDMEEAQEIENEEVN